MESQSQKLTVFDYLLFNKTTIKETVSSGKKKRSVFKCRFNNPIQCNFTVYCKIATELNRLFRHLQIHHSIELTNILYDWLDINYSEDLNTVSCNQLICNFIKNTILPKFISQKKK